MFSTNGFDILKGLTDATVNRQGLLSNNLANIGSENYTRKDVDFGQVLSGLKNQTPGSDNQSAVSAATYNDGQKVNLEKEMSSLYQNHLNYLMLVKALGHHYEHMKKALEVRAS